MKPFGLWAAAVVGLYILQTSLLPLIAYHGVTANLLLLMTVSFAFLRGQRFGVFMGFCAGLLQDLASGTFWGCHTLSYMLLALIFGRLSDRVFKELFFLPIMASVFATAGYYFIFALLLALMGYPFHLGASMRYTLIPMLFYQLTFAYPIHKLAYELDRRTQRKNK